MRKLHLITSSDELKPALCHIKFEHDKTYITNGHIAAILPTDIVLPGIINEGETLYVLGKEWAYAKAYNAISFKRTGNDVICRDAKGNKTVFEFAKPNQFTYPDVLNAFPSESDHETNTLSFDPKLYVSLLDGIGFERAVMKFSGENRAIKIIPYTVDYGTPKIDTSVLALLMPLQKPSLS